jgi:hypothetical protein
LFEWDDAKSCQSDFRSFLLVADKTMERRSTLVLVSKREEIRITHT